MSIFASQTTETLPIPFDAPHTATIQKLAGKDVDAAQLDHMAGVVTGRGRNWAVRFLELARANAATEKDARKVLDDPLSGYDRLTLVRRGLKAWTYEIDGKPKPITDAAIEDLDDEALEFLARAVLQLTKPALFQTADEREAAQKNG
jgi:hypothetical protein